jgi:hypothetical protein
LDRNGMPNRSRTIIKGQSAHAAPKRVVIAKAERRLAQADRQRARIKADPVREVVRERLRVKRAKKKGSGAQGPRGEKRGAGVIGTL